MKITPMRVVAFSILLLSFSFISCEEDSVCKQCSGDTEIETFIDGQSFSTANSEISAVQYCGEALSTLEASSPIEQEVTQTVDGITQRIVTTTTYTCQ